MACLIYPTRFKMLGWYDAGRCAQSIEISVTYLSRQDYIYIQ